MIDMRDQALAARDMEKSELQAAKRAVVRLATKAQTDPQDVLEALGLEWVDAA